MRVLVPLRIETGMRISLRAADTLARSLNASVVLLGVGDLPETAGQGREEAVELRTELHRAAAAFHVPVTERLEPSAEVVRAVLHAAEDEDVDLIALVPGAFEFAGESEREVASRLRSEGRFPVRVLDQADG